MTIQQCKYVLEVAESGSFNEAAKRLFIAQSSLSSSVKSLEEELGIIIFERTGNGIYLTDEGAEFVCYARRLAREHDFITERYNSDNSCNKLYISTQHYDFIADIFCVMLRNNDNSAYKFSLRETQTYEVIREIETAYSDIGIIAIKGNDEGIMKRYLNKKGLIFTSFIKVSPHVFLRKDHPACGNKRLDFEQLKEYPYVSYEQGEHGNSFFTEEIMNEFSDKHIEISDRASLMNVLLSTDCYTIGTGIMPSVLNNGSIVSIPFESDDYYTIGYILREDRVVSGLTAEFIKLITDSAGK